MVKKMRPRLSLAMRSTNACRSGVASSMNVLMRMFSAVQRATSASVARSVSGAGG